MENQSGNRICYTIKLNITDTTVAHVGALVTLQLLELMTSNCYLWYSPLWNMFLLSVFSEALKMIQTLILMVQC